MPPMGYNKFRHEWDFAGGDAEFKKALALDPNDALAHAWYSENIGTMGGREQEALAEIKRARQLDPASPVTAFDLGNIHLAARRYDEAIAVCKKLAIENPTFALAHYCLSEAYWAKGMHSESIEEWKVESQLSGERNDAELAAAMEQGFRSAGLKGALRKAIEVSLTQHKTGGSSAYSIAALYAQSGDTDQAFQWLDAALQEHDQGLMGLRLILHSIPSVPTHGLPSWCGKVGLPQNGEPSTSEKQQAVKQGTQSPEAYELYLKGRFYSSEETLSDFKTAVSYLNQAIAKDPSYALAYAQLAWVYAGLPDVGDSSVEDYPKAMALARKALELDPTLSQPHLTLGGQLMFQGWDIPGGVAEFKKAVELDPNNAHVHEVYALNIAILGGMEQEAIAEANRAHQLDPESATITYNLGNVQNFARQYDDAIAICKKLASDNPTFANAHNCLAGAYWGKHMYSESIEEWKVYGQFTDDQNDAEYASALVRGFRSAGLKGALNQSIETLKARRKTRPSSAQGSAYIIAEAFTELGDKDQAFQWLSTAYQEHDEGLMGLKTDYRVDPIRSDPRFAELVRKVGLSQ
jgi:tetratricopeptide (TPR) repeat protein